MKKYILNSFLLMFLISCSSTETKEYELKNLRVSGEYLFEGPNTLQGQSTINLKEIAENLNIDPIHIKSVYVGEASITFEPDSLRNAIESALVQWVSNDLELVSVATKSPLPDTESIALEVNQEQDILPYLKDESSTLVVDANITENMDFLEATVSFKLNVEYTN